MNSNTSSSNGYEMKFVPFRNILENSYIKGYDMYPEEKDCLLNELANSHPKNWIGEVSLYVVKINATWTTAKGHEKSGFKYSFMQLSTEEMYMEAYVRAETYLQSYYLRNNDANFQNPKIVDVEILCELGLRQS